MLGFALIVSIAAAVLACYAGTILALFYLVTIREPDPGDRARIGITAAVMLVMGVTLHITGTTLIEYAL